MVPLVWSSIAVLHYSLGRILFTSQQIVIFLPMTPYILVFNQISEEHSAFIIRIAVRQGARREREKHRRGPENDNFKEGSENVGF